MQMLDAVRNAFRLPDLRRKLLYTLFILLVYQFAAHIPVPGVDRKALDSLLNGQAAGFIQILNLLSGGAVSSFSVLANGVYPYITAQMLGAFAGAVLVWLHFLPHWKETPDRSAKLACFCTGPAIRGLIPNLLSEIIGTFVLVFVVLYVPVGLCSALQRHYGPDLPRGKRGSHQVSHAHQVVGRASERKDPIHLQRSAMPHLA